MGENITNPIYDRTKPKGGTRTHTEHLITDYDMLQRDKKAFYGAFKVVMPGFKSIKLMFKAGVIPQDRASILYRVIWRRIFDEMISRIHEGYEYQIAGLLRVSMLPCSRLSYNETQGMETTFSRNYPTLSLSDIGYEPWAITLSPIPRIGQKPRASHRMLLAMAMRGKYDDKLKAYIESGELPTIANLHSLIRDVVKEYPMFDPIPLEYSMKASFTKFARFISKGATMQFHSGKWSDGVGYIFKLGSKYIPSIERNCEVEWYLNYYNHTVPDRRDFYLGMNNSDYRKYIRGEKLTSNLQVKEDCVWKLYRSKYYCKYNCSHVFSVKVNLKFFPKIDMKVGGRHRYTFHFIGRLEDFISIKKIGTRYRYPMSERIKHRNEKKKPINL
jgi:hypothetical protein